MMKNGQGHVHLVGMIKRLMLDITLLVALGFPPNCSNSNTISVRP